MTILERSSKMKGERSTLVLAAMLADEYILSFTSRSAYIHPTEF